MSARVATQAEQIPRRARYLVPKGLPRRGEFLAACVVLVVLAHVLFAQLTIVVAVVFALTTRATRWRLSWLLVPVVTGAAWTLRTVAAILANPRYTGRQVWNRQRTDFDLVDPVNTALGHRQVQRWNLPEGWVISRHPAHAALV